ncbi:MULTISPECIES: helix-turn-helix transcriptional regulator [unclassified Streptomyces]|uniref:helix-turn-helix transcriptional regulator n=1 Tax=unclassified Streptomyces TaxID=2593676 RepID=UPI00331D3904
MALTFFDAGRLTRDLYAAAGQDADPGGRGAGISRVLAPLLPHDGLSLVATDPATGLGLGSFSFWHEYAPSLVTDLVMHRYRGGDPYRPAALAGLSTPATVVGPPGDGPADARVREILTANGAGSELRLLLQDRHGVWGALGLLRCAGACPFGPDDLQRAARLGPALVAALRRYVTDGPLFPVAPALPTGVVTVGSDHSIRAVSPQARDWLDRLSSPTGHVFPEWVPDAFLIALSLAARSHARDAGAWLPLVCAPPVVCGRWMTLQGQPLDADATGDVALIVQGAAGDLVMPSFCAWYGVTPRERATLCELRAGAAVKQIARRLDLSPYTVNDHLKALFRKTGADGRDELIAALTR